MGVDQSTLSSAPLKSQRDEDIPYTSCSISKPIGSGINPNNLFCIAAADDLRDTVCVLCLVAWLSGNCVLIVSN